MANIEINNLVDFKCWVRTELLKQDTSQRALARRLKVPETRISEAVNGQASGRKYVVPLIEMLGGNAEDFKAIM